MICFSRHSKGTENILVASGVLILNDRGFVGALGLGDAFRLEAGSRLREILAVWDKKDLELLVILAKTVMTSLSSPSSFPSFSMIQTCTNIISSFANSSISLNSIIFISIKYML
jgi:hypothetical protein